MWDLTEILAVRKPSTYAWRGQRCSCGRHQVIIHLFHSTTTVRYCCGRVCRERIPAVKTSLVPVSKSCGRPPVTLLFRSGRIRRRLYNACANGEVDCVPNPMMRVPMWVRPHNEGILGKKAKEGGTFYNIWRVGRVSRREVLYKRRWLYQSLSVFRFQFISGQVDLGIFSIFSWAVLWVGLVLHPQNELNSCETTSREINQNHPSCWRIILISMVSLWAQIDHQSKSLMTSERLPLNCSLVALLSW